MWGRGWVAAGGIAIGVGLSAGGCHSAQTSDPPPAPTSARAARDSMAATRPACLAGGSDSTAAPDLADATWTEWPLDSLRPNDTASAAVRAVRLPARFQQVPARPRLDGTPRLRWVAPDSTMLDLWESDLPTSEMGGSGVAQFAREGMCGLRMTNGKMLVTRYWVLFNGQSDTLYNAAATTVLSSGPALDASIRARSRAARDTLLGAIANVAMPATPGAPTGRARLGP